MLLSILPVALCSAILSISRHSPAASSCVFSASHRRSLWLLQPQLCFMTSVSTAHCLIFSIFLCSQFLERIWLTSCFFYTRPCHALLASPPASCLWARWLTLVQSAGVAQNTIAVWAGSNSGPVPLEKGLKGRFNGWYGWHEVQFGDFAPKLNLQFST